MHFESYVYKVAEILNTRGYITSWDAIRIMGNTRLSATIHTLRHKHDMPIITEMRYADNGKKYGYYYLKKGETNEERV